MTTPTNHSLNLDKRQRDMLAAMGVTCWWPEAPANQVTQAAAVATPAPPNISSRPAHAPATTPATATAPSPTYSSKTAADNAIQTSGEAVFDPEFVPPAPEPATAVSHLDWPGLTQAIQHCTACGLCQGRKQAVPGMGNPMARWMIVGEAPGEQEDQQGLPFVGPAGQLLDAMLVAMGLTREADVYVANVIKCRPPLNRNPDPAEVARCAPFLFRQIELVQPDLILAMGRFAAQTLLAGTVPQVDKLPLGKLRGQVHMAAGRPVVATYHPAYLLRNPADKGKVWNDLCLAMAHMGHNPMDRYRA